MTSSHQRNHNAYPRGGDYPPIKRRGYNKRHVIAFGQLAAAASAGLLLSTCRVNACSADRPTQNAAVGAATQEQVTFKSVAEAGTPAATTVDMSDCALKLTVTGKDAFGIKNDLAASWGAGGQDGINGEAVYAWVEKELAGQLNSAGAKRSYTRGDGKQVSVTGGPYGWTIDVDETARLIVERLENKDSSELDVPMEQSAAAWNPGGADWGARYLDVDTNEQHVRLFDESGKLAWEADCVTGDPQRERATPEGVYQINDQKESGKVSLEGPFDEQTGLPEYTTYVSYWMPFVDDVIAFHDAPWRYTFGGEMYLGNGSHGCVNLSEEQAAELFELCRVGDVVVVHS